MSLGARANRAAGGEREAATGTEPEAATGFEANPVTGLVRASIRLGRALRRRGVTAMSAGTVDAARALEAVDLGDRGEVYLALRSVLVARVEDYDPFDEAFAETWGAAASAGGRARTRSGRGGKQRTPAERSSPRLAAAGAPIALERSAGPEGDDDADPAGFPTVSDREVRARKDFSTFDRGEADAVTRAARRLARRLARRPGRRWKATRRGPRVDARRTMRRAFRTAGEPVELAFRRRKPRKTRLVALCDVSGSMDVHSRLLLRFLHALQNCPAAVETFVFGTRLERVTEELRGRSYRRALERLGVERRDWSGGTRIGASLAAFAERWPRLVDRRTVVVILSDGWDTGQPELLGRAMRSLRRRARRLVWLNPLLANPDYRPLTRGMRAALPHVDVFASAHDAHALNDLAAHPRL